MNSPESFPDEVSKYKVVNGVAIIVGLVIEFSSHGSFFQELMSDLIFGLIFMVFTHFLIVNGAASIKITKLNFQKYWLSYAIADSELVLKIVPALQQMQLHTEVNAGITKGVNITYSELAAVCEKRLHQIQQKAQDPL